MKKTIKTILSEMHDVSSSGAVRPPGWWIDQAMYLASLWQDLKDELTKAEMEFNVEVVDLIDTGKKVAEAERIVKARSEKYRYYKYLKGRDEVISEFIMIAKRRAQIEQA